MDISPRNRNTRKLWNQGRHIFSNWVDGDDIRGPWQWLRDDYKNAGFRRIYATNLYERRHAIMTEVLSSSRFGFIPSPNTTIASIGSGPGAELLATYRHFQQRNALRFLPIDRVRGWRGYTEALSLDQFRFECMDMAEDFDAMAALLADQSTSCVVISHVLVDFPVPDIVIKLFAYVDQLHCVIVLDRHRQWHQKPQTPAGVTLSRVADGDDTVLIYKLDNQEGSVDNLFQHLSVA